MSWCFNVNLYGPARSGGGGGGAWMKVLLWDFAWQTDMRRQGGGSPRLHNTDGGTGIVGQVGVWWWWWWGDDAL